MTLANIALIFSQRTMRSTGITSLLFLAGVILMGCDTMPIPAQIPKKQPVAQPVVKESHPDASAVIKPGFVIRISVMASGKNEFEEAAKRISDNGDISLRLLGTVHVSGLTLDELTARLNSLYTEYYNQPQVVVDFVKDSEEGNASPWGYVNVMGRVVRPGKIAIPPTHDLTVSGAIQQAGGFATSAKDWAIRISRRKADGTTETFDVDLKAVGTSGHLDEDRALQPGDVIFVPERSF